MLCCDCVVLYCVVCLKGGCCVVRIRRCRKRGRAAIRGGTQEAIAIGGGRGAGKITNCCSNACIVVQFQISFL